MDNRLPIWPAILLVVVAAGPLDRLAGAQPTGREVVAGRQQVRLALAKAVADGVLSQSEQQAIRQRAESLLPAGELPGLEQTLSRLAAQYRAAPLSAAGESSQGRPDEGRESQPATWLAGLFAPENESLAETVSYQEPAAADEKPAAEGTPAKPVEEADAADADQPAAGPTLAEAAEKADSAANSGGAPTEHAPAKAAPKPGTAGGRAMADDDTVVFEDYYDTVSAGLRTLYVGGFGDVSLSSASISFASTVDAFKGPLDLDGLNGNFGFGFAVNAGMPLARRFGIGIQAGTGVVLADFHGTPFTGSSIRSQNFTTIGLFQNVPFASGGLMKWGFAYDWLHDSYFTQLVMGQWRVKLAYELDPCREVGIWACIPDKGEKALLGDRQTGQTLERFGPVAQGSLYYRRCWESGITTTGWLGIAGEPGQIVLGSDARVPITCQLALVGSFNCILPNISGEGGQDEELWAVSLGIELTPRPRTNRCGSASPYAPLFPLANNGSFGVRRY